MTARIRGLVKSDQIRNTLNMLHALQIRAARALLGWHQAELAKRAKIGLATIQRLEKGPEGPILAHVATAVKIAACFEKEGIVFLWADQSGGVGVRFAK